MAVRPNPKWQISVCCLLAACIGVAQEEIVAPPSSDPPLAVPVEPPARSSGPLEILSPQPREVVPEGEVIVRFARRGETEPPDGVLHHVFIDQEGPVPHRTGSGPLVLKNLAPGGHLLRVYEAEEDGRLAPAGSAWVYFYVGRKDFRNFASAGMPLLTVNQPVSGQNVPGADGRIWVDFHVHHAEIGGEGGNGLKVVLNGRERVHRKPGPFPLDLLEPGQHRLALELVDGRGDPVPGPYAKVERKFEVVRVLRPLLVDPPPPGLDAEHGQ